MPVCIGIATPVIINLSTLFLHCAGEESLLLLIHKSATEDELQQAIDAVRKNWLMRSKVKQYVQHSYHIPAALFEVRAVIVCSLLAVQG